MKYVLIDAKNGDMFTDEFTNLEEAVEAGERAWGYLTDREKEDREAFYLIESVNPDEEAMNHLDGEVIKEWCCEN